MELVIYLKDDKDWAQLEPILQAMNIAFKAKKTRKKTTTTAQQTQKIAIAQTQMEALLQKGLDVSDFGDPVEWQKEIRKDKPQPFRD